MTSGVSGEVFFETLTVNKTLSLSSPKIPHVVE